jgi:ATP-dependent Lhr-like helicase
MEAVRAGAVEYLGAACSPATALAVLAEPVGCWFEVAFGEPTLAQRLAWPALTAGRDLLLCAPTGSGKTLAAFLPIVDRLLQEPPTGSIRCVYVAPLKALGNDTRTTLRNHLEALGPFLPGGVAEIRVDLRTGDTSAHARRRLTLRPPAILLTTPESLAVLLSYPSAAEQFADLHWIVIDEVHAMAGNKRGADLALSLARLDSLAAGRVRYIGLSATCVPLVGAAQFLTGTGRPCAVARVDETAPLELVVEPLEDSGGFLARLLDRLEPELRTYRTTLIFTNTRGLAERLTWALGRRFPEWHEQIGIHHSALAAARRTAVERRMKEGQLRVVVSSTSLELGIDIGSVDHVVLVHPPGDVIRLLQRVGRAGHGPGRVRRGLILTATAAELLEAAVTGASARSGQCERLRTPAHPLDVLCQHLLGMAAQRAWSANEAFELVRRAFPYRELPGMDFDDCLHYLAGDRADGRPWLPARIRRSGDRFVICDESMARLLRRNLGTIVADEPRPVRLVTPAPGADGARARLLVGEVDEDFADRLQPGDRFLLDGRCLEYRRTRGRALLVDEVAGRPLVPRWAGGAWPLSVELAQRLYVLRIRAAEALRDGPTALAALLRQEYGLHEQATNALVAYFQQQECVSEIPDCGTCLIEVVVTDWGTEYYVHTPLNRAGNDAIGRVAVQRLRRQKSRSVTSIVADLGFFLWVGGAADLGADQWRELLAADSFEADLDTALAGSDTLAERFRRVAQTGLMVLRNPIGGRRRVGGDDWVERRLFAQLTATEPDFVLLRQARREIRAESCDAAAARDFVKELPRWNVRLRTLAGASPFAAAWTQQAIGPMETVEGPVEALQRLHAALTANGERDAG